MVLRSVSCALLFLLTASAAADIHLTRSFLGENRKMKFIDGRGNALAVYTLGEFDLFGMKVPLYAYWTSAEEQSKSRLGYGWHVPWFECLMLPVGEKMYELRSMFGERLFFLRDGKNPKLFRYHDTACAVVSKNEVKVYLGNKPGNLPDMVFLGGRLIQFRYASKAVKIEYENGYFRRMTCGGKTILSADRKTSEPNLIRINFNGDKSAEMIARIDRQEVCVGCSAVGVKFEPRATLVELELPHQDKLVFSYGNQGEMGRMSDGKVNILWDVKSGKLHSYDEWIYDLSQHDPDNGVYRLHRERAGDVEEFSYDAKSGKRVRVMRGIRDVSRLFTSGKLRGKIRWLERTLPGGDMVRTEYSYNQNGTLVYYKKLDKSKGGYSETWNDDNGRIVKHMLDGDETTTRSYFYMADGTCKENQSRQVRFSKVTLK